MSLRELAERHGSDKAAHGYCEPYEEHLGYLRSERFTLIEIGVAAGASLRMWRDYLWRADIIGIDKNPSTMFSGEHRIETILGDAAIPLLWRGSDLSPLVVIDDGSHAAEEIVGAWTHLWPLLRPGGWYAVEDLGAQYCVEFGGSDPDGSIAMDLIADLALRAVRATDDVAEYHLYRELALFRKAG